MDGQGGSSIGTLNALSALSGGSAVPTGSAASSTSPPGSLDVNLGFSNQGKGQPTSAFGLPSQFGQVPTALGNFGTQASTFGDLTGLANPILLGLLLSQMNFPWTTTPFSNPPESKSPVANLGTPSTVPPLQSVQAGSPAFPLPSPAPGAANLPGNLPSIVQPPFSSGGGDGGGGDGSPSATSAPGPLTFFGFQGGPGRSDTQAVFTGPQGQVFMRPDPANSLWEPGGGGGG